MAGHSHFKNIARHKAVVDAKRGKVFSKLSRYIIIAAKHGGPDPDTNLKLQYAIEKARAVSMPKDNIERAIKRGAGTGESDNFDELTYEGFGPGGVAILVETLTDNRNRTNGEVRKIYDKTGGNMGNPGCVSYLFERKGVFLIESSAATEDQLMNLVLEAGAEDLQNSSHGFQVTCDVLSFNKVQDALKAAGITVASAEISQIPKVLAEVDVETGKKIIKMMDILDDHDDVQNVYTNANLTDEMHAD
jgi:YebC/PmpR family DNA-binding regulatory protein